MAGNYTESLIFTKNLDENGTPYIPKLIEVAKVSETGRIQCQQNIYKKNGIKIISPLGLKKVTKASQLVNETSSYFVYEDRAEVLFSEDLIDQVIVFEYYGTGNPNIGDCRVFTTVDNFGNITETLNDVIKDGRDIIESIKQLGGAIVILNKLEEVLQNAENLNIALGIKITVGTQVSERLEADIEKGNAVDSTLKATISKAEKTDSTVNATINTANATNEKVKTTINTANTTDSNLKVTINTANTTDEKVKTTISKGEQTSTKLEEQLTQINESENKVIQINPEDWVLNSETKMYEKIVIHGMGKTSGLIFDYQTVKNGKKCSYFMDYEIENENSIRFITESADTVFVTITAKYYTGLGIEESLLEVDKLVDGSSKVIMTRDERESLPHKINFTVDNTSNVEIPQVDEKLDIVSKKYDIVSSQLEQKAQKTEVRVSTLEKPINVSEFDTETKKLFTGGAVAVVDKNTVLEETIVDRQVSNRKTTFIKDENNIWIESSDYVYISPQTGIWQSETFEFTDFKVGDSFILYIESVTNNSDNVFAEFTSYREDGTAIKSKGFEVSLGNKSEEIIVTPDTAKIKVILFAAQTTTINEGTKVIWKNIRLIKNGDLNFKLSNDIKIEKSNLKDIVIDTNETSFFTPDYNLYDTANITLGKFIDQNNGEIGSDSNCALSDYIPVKENLEYYKKYYGAIAYFNSKKEFIGGLDKGTADAIYVMPKNCAYVRITVVGTYNFYREIFSLASADHKFYMPYGTKFLKSKYIDTRQLNGYYGKNLTSFGHSLVGMGKWQDYVCEYFGMTHTNCGQGGSTVAGESFQGSDGELKIPMWKDERINKIPTDTDLLLILCGKNDYHTVANGKLGDISSTDTNTFYGAYKTMIEKIYNRCPNARVILLTDLFRGYQQGMNESIYHSINEAIREIAKLYNYPIIESYNYGFNQLNYKTFYEVDDPVHPSYVGGKRMADVIIGQLKLYSPYFSEYN